MDRQEVGAEADESHRSWVGFSAALLAAGYNVASLQPEYAGVDFRRGSRHLSCRRRLNPTFCCGASGVTRYIYPVGYVIFDLNMYCPACVPRQRTGKVPPMSFCTAAWSEGLWGV